MPPLAFEPIAIVGRGCALPGADSPDALWEAVHAGRDLLTSAPADRWGLPPALSLTDAPSRSEDRAWSDRGGYVRGFEERFQASLTADPFPGLPAEALVGLDRLTHLLLHTGREALREAGWDGAPDRSGRIGAILGNLSFPSASMARFAESVWLAQQGLLDGRARQVAGHGLPDPRNRFMSGLPVHLMAQALGIGGGAFALDAACASSLYAIKLACDRLHDRSADLMLAGAVCCADDLFIHVGFCALNAMSRTGRSRPFHRDADGLVPAEGAAVVALKRLSDAVAAGDRIFGVIRGVGLSNDGRGRGFLAPSAEGQVRAMRQAYTASELRPEDLTLIECHATGTTVGDATELASMGELFQGADGLPIGSLKSNLGHLITAAGAAGLLKVLSAMHHGIRPPTLHAEAPNPALQDSPFRLLTEAEPWEGRRLAGINAFGFGGNNAHLVVEAFDGPGPVPAAPPPPSGDLAIVRIGAAVADGATADDLLADLVDGADKVAAGRTRSPGVKLPLTGLRFPPRDLQQTLGQQTLLLQASMEALDGMAPPRERTLVLIGAQADPEVARYGARWRLRHWARAWAAEAGVQVDPEWVTAATDAVIPVLRSAGVVGNMPNIPANRLNSQFDLGGPSYTVAAEEHSGLVALQIAARALRSGEADTAVVGASDLSHETVHATAARALGDERPPGDAAVVLVLKRLTDARRDGDTVLAVLPDRPAPAADVLELGDGGLDLSRRLGHAHAACGLVHVAAAALALHHRRRLTPDGPATPWEGPHRSALVRAGLRLTPHQPAQTIRLQAADDRPAPAASRRPAKTLDLPAHPPAIRLPELPVSSDIQRMLPAPPLPPASEDPPPALAGPTGFGADAPPPGAYAPAPSRPAHAAAQPASTPSPRPEPQPHGLTAPPAAAPVAAAPVAMAAPPAGPPSAGLAPSPMGQLPTDPVAAARIEVARQHAAWMRQQADVHQRYLQVRHNALAALTQAWQGGAPGGGTLSRIPASAPPLAALPTVAPPPASTAPPAPAPQAPRKPPEVSTRAPASPAPRPKAPATPAPAPAARAPAAKAFPRPTPAKPTAKARPDLDAVVRTPPPEQLPGPKYNRRQLESLASDRISEVFGPLFACQDDFPRQVRMPEPPLLLADRVTGIDAEPGSMTTGTIWTETDVTHDAWYLHDGVMPAGVMIESGQADLLLISWLGADFHNKGERVYRLLGCELTYHGGLPRPGETLQYDIHIDGHANHGDTRIFFFHYDCRVDGVARLQVREGQAGFFSDEELAQSGGILWTPETGEVTDTPRLDPPRIPCTRDAFSAEQIAAFSEGDGYACFGEGFEYLQAHVRTPRISPAPMLFMHRVTDCDAKGGPWKRGYLRAEQDIRPDDWFFDGHFKDDPCMPGTLMFEGCLQALSFYMASLGFTVDRDGWRFEPVPDVPYQLRCRGQVIPSTSKLLVYEIFVEEVIDGDERIIWADFLCTVDGLKAFHARRVGLKLVPDWPLSSRPEILADYEDPKPVATVDGFKFGFASLMACAWGRPSEAFGPMYTPFDTGRHCARLPGPPYHFMTRLTRIDGPIGGMQTGTEIELEYDVPPDAWYFDENGCRSMPFCVLLEAALQPCGWIACYIGSALTTEEDLFFRNLDGTATWTGELFPQTGTLRTVAKITNISLAGGMIIEGFDVDCYVGDTKIYTMKTVFGFFPRDALANQIGITPTPADREALHAPCDFLVDLTERPARYTGGPLRLPTPMLCMLDRITGYWPDGGKKGLGRIRSEKDVDPAEWFFKAHFYTDPVQPGSLGLEAMVQVIQFFMIHEDLHEGMANPRFEPLAMGEALTWKYRGQVVPRNKVIRCEMDIVEVRRDETGVVVVADGWLWVDDLRIYGATGMAVRVVDAPIPPELDREERESRLTPVEGDGAQAAGEGVLDPEKETWLADHCPTWTVPALPAMAMADRLAAAVGAQTQERVIAVEDLQVHRWLTLPGPTRTRVEVGEPQTVDGQTTWPAELQAWREARNPALSRFEPVATGTVRTAATYPSPPAALPPLTDAEPQPDPYAAGHLFHGPALQLVTSLSLGATGSSAVLDAGRSAAPRGVLNPGLLDALTHAIPHDRMHRWDAAIPADQAAYPWRVEALRLYGPLPTGGEVQVEARFAGFADADKRHPVTEVQALVDGQVRAELRLAEILVPKGPVGSAAPERRVAFLRGDPADGLGLSSTEGNTTRLQDADLAASDWLPGTVRAAWKAQGDDLAAEVAVKEHVARQEGVHPSAVQVAGDEAILRTQPLTRWPVSVSREPHATVVTGEPPRLEIDAVRQHWDAYFQLGRWPVEDLYYGLIDRFVNRVHLTDPDGFDAVRGRSLLYVANHQVGVESLLFSIVASGLTGVNTVTLAKMEHKTTWLGRLIAHCFSWPGAKDPEVITFFDRKDKRSLPRIVGDLAAEMAGPGKSVMVHIEGTRSLECRTPVKLMSSIFIDMALKTGSPIVPVRFTGALPTEPMDKRIEFPVGMGKQDIWFGRPLLPEEVAEVPLRERKAMVIEAINALGPPNAEEEPLPGDPAFAATVDAWMAESGADHEHATLLRVLQERDDLAPQTRRLLEAVEAGELVLPDDGEGRWLAELGRRMFGARGPKVVLR